MDTIPWPHQGEIGLVKPSLSTSIPFSSTGEVVERKVRPQKEGAFNCPRCNSTNTKFCYYNNYSLTQPRYFCKTCRRYWTEGGSLRNVPVGGGSRKNKRSSSSSSNTSTATAPPQAPLQNPKFTTHHQNEFYELLGNSSVHTPTWSGGVDLLVRSPFVQVPMMGGGGVCAGDQGFGLQGPRSVGVDLAMDHGGYDYMQGVMLSSQEMGKVSSADQGMGGGDPASGGVWNW